AKMSLPPPAANGTIMRIGLLGKPAAGSVCACEGCAVSRAASAVSATRWDRLVIVIVNSSGPWAPAAGAAPQASTPVYQWRRNTDSIVVTQPAGPPSRRPRQHVVAVACL